MIRYAKPRTVEEALALLAEDRWRILAGGTDVYPAQGARPFRDNLLDINGLDTLARLEEDATGWRIGARVSWSAVAAASLPPAFDALRQAAHAIGSVQIQNTATLAGNLCNASPAADGVPPLLALDAQVELASLAGRRSLPLSEFLIGNRRIALRPDELMTAVLVRRSAVTGRSAFLKLGARRYLVISIAMVAARVALRADGAIAESAVALGSCSEVAVRLRGVEAAIAGLQPGPRVAEAITRAPLEAISPIDDVRGSADYRREAARTLVLRAVEQALEGGHERVRAA